MGAQMLPFLQFILLRTHRPPAPLMHTRAWWTIEHCHAGCIDGAATVRGRTEQVSDDRQAWTIYYTRFCFPTRYELTCGLRSRSARLHAPNDGHIRGNIIQGLSGLLRALYPSQ